MGILGNLAPAGLFLLACAGAITLVWLTSINRYQDELCQSLLQCDPSQPLTPEKVRQINQSLLELGQAVRNARIRATANTVVLFVHGPKQKRSSDKALAAAERQLTTAYKLAAKYFGPNIQLRPRHHYILPELDNLSQPGDS